MELTDKALKVLTECGLYIKLKKCTFMRNTIQYLGFIISADTIKVDKDRTRSIEKLQEPPNKLQLQIIIDVPYQIMHK